MTIHHLVPKADADIETAMNSPIGLYEMIKWLKLRGVSWNEPDPALTTEELKTIVRVIFRQLRMRENADAAEDTV